MSEFSPDTNPKKGQSPRPKVLFASNNFNSSGIMSELLYLRAANMAAYAQERGFDGVALMAMRWWIQTATQDVNNRRVRGVKLLQEAWQLNPAWSNPKSVIKNAMFRAVMPSTHIGPWQPAVGAVERAQKRNPVPAMIYLDPSGDVGRDRRKVERLGGHGNVSVRITARFMELAGADSPDAIVNELGERNLLGVFDTFESDSRSPKTGELPQVASQAWLGPVASAGLLGGVGFSAYRIDQARPDPERVRTNTREMDQLLFNDELTGELHDQITALKPISVPYVVLNMPYEGAARALDRHRAAERATAPISAMYNLHALAATTIRAYGVGTAAA